MSKPIRVDVDHQVPFEESIERYRQALRKDFMYLRVLGGRQVFDINDVFIPLKLRNIESDLSGQEVLGAEDIFANNSRVAVLGLPGSGKTTLLRYLAFKYSSNDKEALPIYFRAARFSAIRARARSDKTPCSLTQFLREQIAGEVGEESAEAIAKSEILARANTVLLIDALDEISPDQSNDLGSELEDFLHSHSQVRVVVTSRAAGFPESIFRRMEFSVYKILDIEPEDIGNYVRRTCRKEVQQNVLDAIMSDDRLLEMAGNPFLLAMMCSYPKELAPVALKRATLYRSCTQYLLRATDYQKGREATQPGSIEILENALKLIALHFYKLDEKILPSREDVEYFLQSAMKNRRLSFRTCLDYTPGMILDQIVSTSGLLQVCGDEYQFVHRSIWEYFVALGLFEEPLEDVLNKSNDPTWEEPIRFFIGLLPEERLRQVIFGIWERNRGLALRSLNEREAFPSSLLSELCRSLSVDDRIALLLQLRDSLKWSSNNALKQKRMIVDTLSSILRVERNCRVLYECMIMLEERDETECAQLISKVLQHDVESPEKRRERVINESGTDKQRFVRIPATSDFLMGTDSTVDPRETPAHRVKLSSFKISSCLVTNRMYYSCGFPYAEDRRNPYSKDDAQPVSKVNWYEAHLFARWLGCDLPTEAEWEYACRSRGKDDLAFADLKRIGEYAWYGDNSENRTHPVGTKRANSFGLYDVLGNLREWCKDWHSDDYYKECLGTVENPQGPIVGIEKVLRGGCFDWADTHLRPTYRNYNPPSNVYFANGFRIVLRSE